MTNLLKYFCIFMVACVMLYIIGAIFVPLIIVGAIVFLFTIIFGLIDTANTKDKS